MKIKTTVLGLAIISVLIFATTIAYAASGLSEMYYQSQNDYNVDSMNYYLGLVGYDTNLYEGVNAYYVRRTMDEDVIFTCSTSSVAGVMRCNYLEDNKLLTAEITSNNNAYSMEYVFDSGDFDGMDLAYFAGDNTALTSPTTPYAYGNLVVKAFDLGSESVYGFTANFNADYIDYFNDALYSALASGSTVTEAGNEAISETFAYYGWYSGYESIGLAGSTTNTIN